MLARLSSAPLWVRIAAGIALSCAVLLLLLRAFAMTPMARGMVESRLEALSVRGQSVRLEGFKGDLLGRITVERMTVQDEHGIWLKAAHTELKWSPLAILSGELKIRRVMIGDLEVDRRPILEPAAQGGEDSNGFFSRYQVSRLEVSQLSLADGVAGPSQAYELSASFDAGRTRGNAVLDLMPVAGQGDEIEADLAWGAAVPLEGRVQISGAPSGLIASLLEAPDGKAVSATLDASGSLERWELSGNGNVGDDFVFEVETVLRDGVRSLSGKIDLDTLGVLQSFRKRFGDQVGIVAELDEAGRLSLAVDSDTLILTLAGAMQTRPDGWALEEVDLAVSGLNAAAVTGQGDLELTALTANGVLAVTQDAASFDGTFDVPRVRYRNYVISDISNTGRYNLRDGVLALDQSLSLSTLSGIGDVAAHVVEGPVSIDAEARIDLQKRAADITSLIAQNERFRSEAIGEITIGGPVELSGLLTIGQTPGLSQFDGTWTYEGQGFTEGALNLTGSAGLGSLQSDLWTAYGRDARIDLTLEHNQGDLIVERATIESDQARVRASGELSGGALDFDGQIVASSPSLAGVSVDGLDAKFEVTGRSSAPVLNLNMASNRLTAFGQVFDAYTLQGRAFYSGGLAFDFNSSASFMQAPLSAAARGTYQNGVIQVGEIRADWAELNVAGQGRLIPAALRRSDLSLTLDGTAPLVGDVTGSALYSDERLNADLSAGNFSYGPVNVTQGMAELSGTWPRFDGTLDYRGDLLLLGELSPISGRQALNLDLDKRSLSVDGEAQIAGQVISTTSPVVAKLEPNAQIRGGLAAFGGAVAFDLHPDGASPSHLVLDDVSLAQMGPLLQRPSLRGSLSSRIELGISAGELNGTAMGSVVNLARGEPDAPSADVSIDAVIADNELTAQMRAQNSEETLDLVGAFSAPLTHQGTIFSSRPVPGAAVPASLSGGGEIAPLWALVAPPDLRLEGDITVDINNGTGEAFQFNGPLAFENGVFEDGFTGMHLTDLEIDAMLQPSAIAVRQASAAGIRGGGLTASGAYDFTGNGSVNLQLNRLNALNRSDVDVTLSGTANIDRRDRRTRILGDLSIDQARVNLSSLPGAGYTTMDVVFSDQDMSSESDRPVREAIVLELDVTAARRIFVTGPAVDTEWGLDARITGSPGRPSITGRATLVRGEADLLSRRFRLSEGLVRFVGDPTDTELRISAERASGDVSAGIDVTGSVIDPSISLRSDPPLPDDEILARVLFGRSPGELSPLQAAQLAGAAAQLAGGDAFNLMNQLEASVGLDRLDFGFDDDGAATLSTGKYLAEDVYLELQSGGTGAPGVALEWTPLENVEIDAEVDPELGPKVSIQWKRDFDDRPSEPQQE